MITMYWQNKPHDGHESGSILVKMGSSETLEN